MESEASSEGASPDAADDRRKRSRRIATAVIGIGAVVLEPELLPGIAIGLLAAIAPKYIPRLSTHLRPIGNTVRRAAAALTEKGRELGNRAKEKSHDVTHETTATEQAH
jgi:hypothetical protein